MITSLSHKKILLIGNYLPDHQESMQRFAGALEEGLQAKGIPCELIRPAIVFGRYAKYFPRLAKFLGYLDKYLLFPLYLSYFTYFYKFRGVHICDHSNAMYRPWLNGHAALVNCHDLLAVQGAQGKFQHHEVGWSGRMLQAWILKHLNSAEAIAFISDKTRQDFEHIVIDQPMASKRIYMGLTYPYCFLEASEQQAILQSIDKKLLDVPYLLHVGSNSWYKNRKGLVELFIVLKERYRLPHRLVFVGEPLSEDLKHILEEKKLSGEILDLGKQTNHRLNALYSGAEALLFLSLEEGFGWPVLEAMAAGCTVITTRRAPMSEVGGDAAYYVERYPENFKAQQKEAIAWAHQSASQVHAILTQPASAKQQRLLLGQKRACTFSNEKMIADYYEFYEEIFPPLPEL